MCAHMRGVMEPCFLVVALKSAHQNKSVCFMPPRRGLVQCLRYVLKDLIDDANTSAVIDS